MKVCNKLLLVMKERIYEHKNSYAQFNSEIILILFRGEFHATIKRNIETRARQSVLRLKNA